MITGSHPQEKQIPRPLVFVCYSHEDEEEKDTLLSHLGVLHSNNLIELWSDDRIGPGKNWEQEISQVVAQTRVAILLITANFLTSDFILKTQVFQLLKRRESEGLIVFPIIAKSCAWRKVSWLAKMSVRPKSKKPVWRGGASHVDEDLAAIAEEIAVIIEEENNALQAESKPSTPPPIHNQSSKKPLIVTTEIGKWWTSRGYTANPFQWSNAASVKKDNLLDLFSLWHIDPNGPENSEGIGPTPTFDEVKSLYNGEPVLIYAATGSGKTFYRRWAVEQITKEHWGPGYGLQIPSLEEYIRNDALSAIDLARAIYESLCDEFSVRAGSLRTKKIARIFRKCEDIFRESIPDPSKLPLMYVFVDGIDHLFDEDPARAEDNTQTLQELAQFCDSVARRDHSPLALRIFIPLQLKEAIQQRLSSRWRRRIKEYTIEWRPGHCRDIIERRLDSYWELGVNTGVNHLSRLLAEDALDEFDKWLGQQAGLSPRCVIDIMDQLGRYAYNQEVTPDYLITAEAWKDFLRSTDIQIFCNPDVSYPLVVTTEPTVSIESKPSPSPVTDPLNSVPDTRSNGILIVTVTKVEAQAVLTVFSQAAGEKWTRQPIGNKTYYNLGVHGGVPVSMVQSEMGTATPGGALLTVSRAIHDLQPQAVIMCGIAFGLHRDKQQLGEILVARQLLYYEPQKVDFQRGQMPRGDRTTAAERLLDRFRSGDIDWPGAPTHFGLVLSGEKLVNDPTFREWLLQTEPEAIGGEMEGAGLYAAARDTKVDWILVKAICDWADGEKDDRAHSQAANNAAQFVLHVLQLGGWDGPE